jgi:hypothetical protein
MLEAVKIFAKKIPFVPYSYRLIKTALAAPPEVPTTEKIFTNIFEKNEWRGVFSVSGIGSGLDQTRKIVEELPSLLRDLEVSTMLDIPCGDLNWMKSVDLGEIRYLGADIVKELISHNQKKYETATVSFICANLITDKLPAVDLVFCRDCLVHLSFADIFRALKNICDSGSTYLLTTTFPDRTENRDIETGEWRVLNLELEPFKFPQPAQILVEGCTEDNGLFADKSLGLWRIDELKKCLAENSQASVAQRSLELPGDSSLRQPSCS